MAHKDEAKPEPKKETKPDSRGDPHDRIDKLEALMKANGWTL